MRGFSKFWVKYELSDWSLYVLQFQVEETDDVRMCANMMLRIKCMSILEMCICNSRNLFPILIILLALDDELLSGAFLLSNSRDFFEMLVFLFFGCIRYSFGYILFTVKILAVGWKQWGSCDNRGGVHKLTIFLYEIKLVVDWGMYCMSAYEAMKTMLDDWTDSACHSCMWRVIMK